MKYVLEDSIGFLLSRTHTRAKNELLQALKPYNITPEQWGLLTRLWEEDGISQKELANRIFKDQPTTARILEKMEKKKLIARQPDPVDGRVSLVFLTEKGRSLRNKLISKATGVLEKALQGFSDAEVQQLKKMLNRIFHNLK